MHGRKEARGGVCFFLPGVLLQILSREKKRKRKRKRKEEKWGPLTTTKMIS